MTQVWSEEVRTSRWTPSSSRTSGSTSGNLKFSHEPRKSKELSRVVWWFQSTTKSSKLKSHSKLYEYAQTSNYFPNFMCPHFRGIF